MISFIQHVRSNLRSLATQPVFSVVAVVSLAVGIGVNTAIFSAIDALLLRSPAIKDLDRSVIVFDSAEGREDTGTSFPAFQLLRAQREVFSKVMATAGTRPLVLTDGERRDQVYGELVTADFFTMADVGLQIGVSPGADIDRPGDPPAVLVLSHGFWQRRFGSDPSVVGRTLVVNGRVFTVVGVARPGFTGLDGEVSADLWIPLTQWAHLIEEPTRLTGDEHWLRTVATLQPGVTEERARSAVEIVSRQLPRTAGQQLRVRPARQRLTGSVLEAIAIGAAAFSGGLIVLALACANVTSLFLARAAARQREMSVRVALGASRARLVGTWLTECLVLCLSAGGIGLVLASWLIELAAGFTPPVEIGGATGATFPLDFHLDVRVFMFAFGLSTLVACAIGLVVGLQGSKPGVTRAIPSDRTTARRFAPGFNVRSAVIAVQIALSLILLIPCGLFIRSAVNASEMSPGFSSDRVLLLPISSNQAGARVKKPAGFEQELSDRVARLSGVESTTVMDPVPLWFGGKFAGFKDARAGASATTLRLGYSCIGLGYFTTLQIPLLRGRDFSRADGATAPLVAIVNETLARKLWPAGDALGQRLTTHDGTLEIVGIAKDAKYLSLGDVGQGWVYRPIAQDPTDNPALSLAVRTTGDPLALRAAIEREVKALIPGWPSFQFRTLDEGMALQRRVPRFGAMVLGVLGAFGALLAAVGIYGVIAFSVQQRTREIGIRRALGAPDTTVMSLVIRQGMAVCAAGGAVGLIVALVVTQLLRGLLFGISAVDPLAYTAMLSLLAGVAYLACRLPARAALRVNPVDVLRRE